ncbi:MAG: hypothetical protein ACJ75J_11595 [Cytophagaceae bacterium]
MRFLLLFVVQALLPYASIACDCDAPAFIQATQSSALAAKGKALSIEYSRNTFYHEGLKAVFLIEKSYYGFEGRDTIVVYGHEVGNTCVTNDIEQLNIGETCLVNLYPYESGYRMLTCAQSLLQIRNDSVPLYKQTLLQFETSFREEFGPFIRENLHKVQYGDLTCMKQVFRTGLTGEYFLKDSLPDGSYIVLKTDTNGFSVREEAYYRGGKRIGRYRQWYGGGHERLSTFYNQQGHMDRFYHSYYPPQGKGNGPVHEFYTLNNGIREGNSYWPNGNYKETLKRQPNSDTLTCRTFNERRQITAEGYKVGNRFTGEKRSYYSNGDLESVCYTDAHGIQGTYLLLEKDHQVLTLIPYRNDTMQGKVVLLSYKKPFVLEKGEFSKGVLKKNFQSQMLRETDYKNGKQDGREVWYNKGKASTTRYFENGIFIRCEGCMEF